MYVRRDANNDELYYSKWTTPLSVLGGISARAGNRAGGPFAREAL